MSQNPPHVGAPATLNTDDVRRALQMVYGAWAGTLVAQGRTDDDVAALLATSIAHVDTLKLGPVGTVVAEARETIMTHRLPIIRAVLNSQSSG